MSAPYRMRTKKSWADTYGELGEQFAMWSELRGRRINWRVDNMRGRREVTLTYQIAEEPEVRLDMANHPTAEDNLRVLYLAIEALRLNEVRGIADVVRAAYLALPAPARQRDPYEVLGVRPDADPEIVDAAFRAAAKTAHPDHGGSDEAMAELNAAYEAVKR
jgi:DnaJ-domain-containing protein 1